MAGSNVKSKPEITCYGCQFHGHYRGECPYKSRTGVVSVDLGKIFTQEGISFDIPKLLLLLDTCSTVNVTKNEVLVTNIRDYAKDKTLNATTNGCSQLYKQMAKLLLFPLAVYLKIPWQTFFLSKIFQNFQVLASPWILVKKSPSRLLSKVEKFSSLTHIQMAYFILIQRVLFLTIHLKLL